jgi:hypothetical protein
MQLDASSISILDYDRSQLASADYTAPSSHHGTKCRLDVVNDETESRVLDLGGSGRRVDLDHQPVLESGRTMRRPRPMLLGHEGQPQPLVEDTGADRVAAAQHEEVQSRLLHSSILVDGTCRDLSAAELPLLGCRPRIERERSTRVSDARAGLPRSPRVLPSARLVPN